MLGKRQPLPVTPDIGHGISVDGRIWCALICSVLRAGANDNCRVLVNDHAFIGKSLRFRRINTAGHYQLDESLLIIWFPGAEASEEFVIKNASKGGRIVLDLGGNPFLSEVQHLLFCVSWG